MSIISVIITFVDVETGSKNLNNLLKVNMCVLVESEFESGPACSRMHFHHYIVLTWKILLCMSL